MPSTRDCPSLLLALLAACQGTDTVREMRGQAMGTSYSIKVVLAPDADLGAVHAPITAELDRFAQVFSTYVERSEISRFNHHRSTEPFAASAELRALVVRALDLADKTGGAFDPTVAPVLRLYGFGPGAPKSPPPPEDAALAAARTLVGWQKISVTDAGLVKQVPGLELDLNAIAKGAGVDAVAAVLDRLGYASYMVEIGGEVRCRGRKPGGGAWTLGVADPTRPGEPEFVETVPLVDAAMATSGSYLQARRIGGARVHHIIDPRTGRNATDPVVSVTVIAPDCGLADGLATAMMVLGPEAGAPVLRKFAGVRALFLRQDGDGRLQRFDHEWKE